MSENNFDCIKFMNTGDLEENKSPYLAVTFNVEITDTLLMYHICHLYYNNKNITLDDVLISVRETLSNRLLKDDSYLNEEYEAISKNSSAFDVCLDLFSSVKDELKSFMDKGNSQE